MTRSAVNGPWCPEQLAPITETAKPQVRGGLDTDADVRSHWGMRSSRSDHHAQWSVPLVVVAAAIYSWIAAGFRAFTVAEEIMVAIPALVVFALAWRPSRAPATVQWSRASVACWLGLVALAVGWELLAYFSTPRHDHPTLSVIADEIMSVHVGRAVMFLLWLALGWLLVRRPRVSGS
jgi:hypothetical protein